MPEKSRGFREKIARRRGTTVAVKRSDAGGAPPSEHAAKKSGRVVARTATAARSVAPRQPPGQGKKKRAGESPLETTTRSTKRRGR
jgi:hypothetical protein